MKRGRKRLTDAEKVASYNKRVKYQQNYLKENYRRIAFTLNNEHDKDIIDYLKKKDNMNAYLKELIRKDMKK